MSKKQAAVTGNKVLFVGGPEAGNVRLIPESAGQYVQHDDYVYRILKFAIPGDRAAVYLAYAANEPPIHALVEMWREYSPAIQIKRGISDSADGRTYNKLNPI